MTTLMKYLRDRETDESVIGATTKNPVLVMQKKVILCLKRLVQVRSSGKVEGPLTSLRFDIPMAVKRLDSREKRIFDYFISGLNVSEISEEINSTERDVIDTLLCIIDVIIETLGKDYFDNMERR